MKLVRDILKHKTEVWKVNARNMVFDALVLLKENDIGALIVVDDAGRVVGILSERDCARKVVLEGRRPKDTPVGDIMTPLHELCTICPQNTLEECMVIVTERRVRHLPVLEGNNLVGIISIGDIVKEKISEQQFLIDQLSNYITGHPHA